SRSSARAPTPPRRRPPRRPPRRRPPRRRKRRRPPGRARAEHSRVQLLHPPTDRRHRHLDRGRDHGDVHPRPALLRAVSLPRPAAPPIIRVTATYPGASAVAVEQSVATPIEQEVNGVERMIYMQSSNTSDGRMLLDVSFGVGVNQDTANVLTQNRVATAEARL